MDAGEDTLTINSWLSVSNVTEGITWTEGTYAREDDIPQPQCHHCAKPPLLLPHGRKQTSLQPPMWQFLSLSSFWNVFNALQNSVKKTLSAKKSCQKWSKFGRNLTTFDKKGCFSRKKARKAVRQWWIFRNFVYHKAKKTQWNTKDNGNTCSWHGAWAA